MILSVLGILFPVVLLLALGATLRCIGRLAAEMAANPLIVGSLVGLALLALRRGFGVMLPAPVVKTMSLLGAMATLGALLALGASLTPERLRAALRPAALAVAFKLVLCPLLGAAVVLSTVLCAVSIAAVLLLQ